MKYPISTLFLILAFQTLAQSSSTPYLQYQDGTEIFPSTLKYKSPVIGKQHLLIGGEKKVNIEEVKAYQDATGYYLFDYVSGYSRTRLKRETVGKISTYSRTFSTYVPGAPGMPGGNIGYFSNTKQSYFQKEDQPIQPVNYLNLERAVRDNPQSMAHIEKHNALRKLSIWSYVGGGLLIIGGIAHMSQLNQQEGPPPYNATIKFSPWLFVGAAVVTIPLFTNNTKNEQLQLAIKKYNQ